MNIIDYIPTEYRNFAVTDLRQSIDDDTILLAICKIDDRYFVAPEPFDSQFSSAVFAPDENLFPSAQSVLDYYTDFNPETAEYLLDELTGIEFSVESIAFFILINDFEY